MAAALRLGPQAPPLRLLATEAPRAALEMAALVATSPLLALGRRGDGHRVLVLPGLLGGDRSTLLLRRYLTYLGYTVSGWQLGANVGPTEAVVSGLRARLAKLADESGGPVSIVGWSLGGLYAHELARRAPASVRQVITMGSPVRLAGRGGRAGRASRTGSALFDRFSHLQVAPSLAARPWSESGALRVPATAIYTRSDGVVAWRSCLLPSARRRENVEVYGSHVGLAHNPAVLHLLADRLHRRAGVWRPFAPALAVRPFYPSP